MILTFPEINDLHKATRSGLTSRWKDFHIIRNEAVSDQLISQMPAHRCHFHQICLDHESDYKLGMDAQTRQITNDNLYFIPKGTIMSWESDHVNLWKGYTIFFKPEFFSEYGIDTSENLFANLKPTVFTLKQEALHHLSAFCEQMLEEQNLQIKGIKRVLRDWFSLFLQYCDRYYKLSEETSLSYETKVKYKFQELLNFNIEKEHSVSFYADALSVSPRHFTRLVKKVTGTSAKQMIQDKIIDVAKERLLNSELDVSQIAYGLGFNNSTQFTRVFKRITGTCPSKYRKLAKEIG